MIKLYHGSNVKILQPDLKHSKPFKDFGQGFYLSADKQQAWDMAYNKVEQLKEGSAELNTFIFDEALMSSGELNVKVFEDYTEEWAEFVLVNRDERVIHPCHNYDIVYGPIADDGVGYQLRRYKGGVISLQKLIDELRFAKGITFQYFFGTERAINKLKVL